MRCPSVPLLTQFQYSCMDTGQDLDTDREVGNLRGVICVGGTVEDNRREKNKVRNSLVESDKNRGKTTLWIYKSCLSHSLPMSWESGKQVKKDPQDVLYRELVQIT